MRDPRWALLAACRPVLLSRFASRGVVRVDFVAAFPLPSFAVWLCTSSDAERDALGVLDPCLEEVRAILREVGFAVESLRSLVTVAQSQQTVDRDFEGSWFYAMR